MQSNADGGWRKSSRCGANGGCVEVGFLPGGIAVRDSKAGLLSPQLIFGRGEWSRFINGVKEA